MSYTGLLLEWVRVGGAAQLGQCEVTGNLTSGIWNPVELKGTVGGALTLLINGTSALSGCALSFPATTTSSAIIGLSTNPSTTIGWGVYYDDVVAVTRR
jgi:hypothetical protein